MRLPILGSIKIGTMQEGYNDCGKISFLLSIRISVLRTRCGTATATDSRVSFSFQITSNCILEFTLGSSANFPKLRNYGFNALPLVNTICMISFCHLR